MRKNVLIALLGIGLGLSVAWNVTTAGPVFEHTVYHTTDAELVDTLKSSANSNQREGFIRVTFTEGDYSGGNDASITVDLIMTESLTDPFNP